LNEAAATAAFVGWAQPTIENDQSTALRPRRSLLQAAGSASISRSVRPAASAEGLRKLSNLGEAKTFIEDSLIGLDIKYRRLCKITGTYNRSGTFSNSRTATFATSPNQSHRDR
jgi:hypothetical protein